jgi:hypothetical protein
MTEIAMQQCHVLSQYGGNPRQAIQVGRRALETANRLEDEALAYGVRLTFGGACWIGGDYDGAVELLSANLPENMVDPTRIRDFGTAGSLLLDSMSILANTLAHRGHFDRAFAILERAQALPQKNAFDVCRQFSSRASAPVPRRRGIGWADIAGGHRARTSRRTRVLSPLASGPAWLRPRAERGIRERDPPPRNRPRKITRDPSAIPLPRRPPRCWARRSRPWTPDEPSTSPRQRSALRGQADFALWKRNCFESKRPRCSASTSMRPRSQQTKAISLRRSWLLAPNRATACAPLATSWRPRAMR